MNTLPDIHLPCGQTVIRGRRDLFITAGAGSPGEIVTFHYTHADKFGPVRLAVVRGHRNSSQLHPISPESIARGCFLTNIFTN